MTETQMNNLDCKDIKAILSGLIDDEVDRATRHAAERHLAECAPCRSLISQAESMNEMIALDAQRHLWPVGLPSGFEDAVLSRTVYGDAYQFAGRQWTSWLGWIAAAACLLLSLSIWFLERQRTAATPEHFAQNTYQQNPTFNMANAGLLRSWTTNDPMPENLVTRTANTADESVDRLIDEQLALVQPVGLRMPLDMASDSVSYDDALTLAAAANLLGMLGQADLNSYADVDRIRRIAEYDNLLDRLSATAQRVSPADRPAVLAAESILVRIVNGPVDLNDVRLMNETVAALNLSARVDAIGDQGRSRSSL